MAPHLGRSFGLFILLGLAAGCYKLTYTTYRGDAHAPDGSGASTDASRVTEVSRGGGGSGGNRSATSGETTNSGGNAGRGGLSASGGDTSDTGTAGSYTSAGGTAGLASSATTGSTGGITSTAGIGGRSVRDAGPNGLSNVETIIRNGRATIEASATLKTLNGSEFRADLKTGDRGRRDRLTALLRDRLHSR